MHYDRLRQLDESTLSTHFVFIASLELVESVGQQSLAYLKAVKKAHKVAHPAPGCDDLFLQLQATQGKCEESLESQSREVDEASRKLAEHMARLEPPTASIKPAAAHTQGSEEKPKHKHHHHRHHHRDQEEVSVPAPATAAKVQIPSANPRVVASAAQIPVFRPPIPLGVGSISAWGTLFR